MIILQTLTAILLIVSFPTRRSSDLNLLGNTYSIRDHLPVIQFFVGWRLHQPALEYFSKTGLLELRFSCNREDTGCVPSVGDRKSTRLNSSHITISYAVFCLKTRISK